MKRACGLDVHKETIFCAIYKGKKPGSVVEYSTLTPAIRSMGAHLRAEGVQEIAMESTGIYWVPIWNILEEMGFDLILINPYLIKQMPGRKSDVKDAQWIATLLHKGLLRGSLIPCENIRELRTYSRKYYRLQHRQTSVLNELERTMELCGIRITSLVSNNSSKSVLKVVSLIVQGEISPDVLLSEVHPRIVNKHTKAKVRDALTGHITTHHRIMLKQAIEEYEMLVRQSQECLQLMEELCMTHYQQEMTLLQTIPGISQISAMIIIAETGADMRAFENSGKFSGWTGLRPRNDESAGKYKSTATTKGNRYLKCILVQVAWAASRTQGSYFKEKFNRLAMRKSRKKALVAIARKLGVIVWNVLYYKQPYNPEKLIIYDPQKLHAKLNYHQKEYSRIERLIGTA